MMRVRHQPPPRPAPLGQPPKADEFWWNVASSIMGGLIVAAGFFLAGRKAPRGST